MVWGFSLMTKSYDPLKSVCWPSLAAQEHGPRGAFLRDAHRATSHGLDAPHGLAAVTCVPNKDTIEI